MRLQRTLAYALIELTLVTLASKLVTKGGLKEILGALSWGSYVPLAIATAAAITDQKGLVIALVIITILIVIPTSLQAFARAILPTGAGILLGTGLRMAIKEGSEA